MPEPVRGGDTHNMACHTNRLNLLPFRRRTDPDPSWQCVPNARWRRLEPNPIFPSWLGVSRPPTPGRLDRCGGCTTAGAWVAGTRPAMTERSNSAQVGAGGRSGRTAMTDQG